VELEKSAEQVLPGKYGEEVEAGDKGEKYPKQYMHM
jgi:hypothetical protein